MFVLTPYDQFLAISWREHVTSDEMIMKTDL